MVSKVNAISFLLSIVVPVAHSAVAGLGDVHTPLSLHPDSDHTPVITDAGLQHGVVQVTSDGSQERPFCTWTLQCDWNANTQQECAQKLCEASGHKEGTFVTSSGDMCTSWVEGHHGSAWYWVADLQMYNYQICSLETAITADCFSAIPSTISEDLVSEVTPLESIVLQGPIQPQPHNVIPNSQGSTTGVVQITSDGSPERPFCTWTLQCVWNASTQQECAQKLCEASGYKEGKYVTSSGDMCTSWVEDHHGSAWYWVTDFQMYNYQICSLETAITADCFSGPAVPSSINEDLVSEVKPLASITIKSPIQPQPHNFILNSQGSTTGLHRELINIIHGLTLHVTSCIAKANGSGLVLALGLGISVITMVLSLSIWWMSRRAYLKPQPDPAESHFTIAVL